MHLFENASIYLIILIILYERKFTWTPAAGFESNLLKVVRDSRYLCPNVICLTDESVHLNSDR